MVAEGDAELELRVESVAIDFPDVVVDAGGAEGGAGESGAGGELGAEDADALGAGDEDFVAGDEGLEFVDEGWEGGDEVADAVDPAFGDFAAEASEAHVVAHHAGSGEGFEEVEEFFALPEGIHEGGAPGAHVTEEEAEEGGVVLEAGEFGEDDAEVLGAFGDFESGEFFDGEGVGPVVGHGAEVVEAVGVGHDGEVAEGLADFFVVAVEVSEDGLELDDGFAVQGDVHAEDAVGGGVLGPHGDFEDVAFELGGPWGRGGLEGSGHARGVGGVQCFWVGGWRRAAFSLARSRMWAWGGGFVFVVVGGGVVFAHGMVLELVPHEDAPEVGVAMEADAVEVENLAFLEFGGAPDGGERGERGEGRPGRRARWCGGG